MAKSTKREPLKKGDITRLAMECLMGNTKVTKEHLKERKRTKKWAEELAQKVTAAVGSHIDESEYTPENVNMAFLIATTIACCNLLFLVEKLLPEDYDELPPYDVFLELLSIYKPYNDKILEECQMKANEEEKEEEE